MNGRTSVETAHPQRAVNGQAVAWRATSLVLWSVLVLASVYLGRTLSDARGFSPDSWTYYEISTSVFSDPMRVEIVRQFQFQPPYQVSFPPLWPTAIALADAILRQGPATAVWLNLALVSVAALIGGGLFARLGMVSAAGPLLMLGMLAWGPFRAEVASGRSFPLAIVLLLLLTSQMIRRPEPSLGDFAMCGLLLGGLTMARFDWLVPGLLLLAGLALISPRPRLRRVVAGYAVLLLTLAPWIIYSLVRFNRVFASDNSIVALSAQPIYVTDYLPVTPASALDDPGAWLAKLADQAEGTAWTVISSLKEAAVVLIVVTLLSVLTLFRTRLRGWKTKLGYWWQSLRLAFRRAPWRARRLALLGIVLIVQGLLPSLVLGYTDTRYLSGVFLAGLGVALWLPWSALRLAGAAQTWRVVGVVAAVVLALNSGGLASWRYPEPLSWASVAPTELDAKLSACVAGERLIVTGGNETFASRFAAVSESHVGLVAMMPGNWEQLGVDGMHRLLREYRFEKIYVPPGASGSYVDWFFQDPAAQPYRDGCMEGLFDVP